MQQKVKDFNNNLPCHKKPMPIEARLLDIQSELGELSKEYLKSTKYGTENFALSNDFKLEFGDVIYSLLSLANEANINAEECLNLVIEKYKNRLIKNNDLGNKN
ncbi:MAG: MazG-like family protein [Clostridia bacterium]|nr:MazG-like family protein [Clostridia bacterium]